MKKFVSMFVAASALLGAAVAAPAANPGCAAPSAGGEWRSYSHDLSNTRHQPLETTITPGTVENLEASWTFSTDDTEFSGAFPDITPVIADGCVYLNGGRAIYALNADTGALVWETFVGRPGGTPTIVDGKVIVDNLPRSTVALDADTGEVIWEKEWATEQPGATNGAGAVVVNGLVFSAMNLAGAELDDTVRNKVRGEYGILDLQTGAVLAKEWVITDQEMANGYAGGGLWATAAADPTTGFIYEATGNPFLKEHPYTNAIIKIDARRNSPTFGKIVDSFKGTVDTYVGSGTKPHCEAVPSTATCEFDDLDFGASPQLFTTSSGRKLVGDLQKSGEYHAADAGTMDEVWSTIVGSPALPAAIFMGAASTGSFDGEKIITMSGYPGVMHGLKRNDGRVDWSHPVGSYIPYHAVTTAGGLAYTIDQAGILWAIDTSNGVAEFTRQMSLDLETGAAIGGLTAAGVAVARNKVYAPVGNAMVVYELPQA